MHSFQFLSMTHIYKNIPISHGLDNLTMSLLLCRHSEAWVYYTSGKFNNHPKGNHCMLRICHILLSLTDETKTNIKKLSGEILHCNTVNIRKLAKLLSNQVNNFPAVRFRPLLHSYLEKVKLLDSISL